MTHYCRCDSYVQLSLHFNFLYNFQRCVFKINQLDLVLFHLDEGDNIIHCSYIKVGINDYR